MSEPTYDLSFLIVLPFPRPRQGVDGQWRRTWQVRLCTPASGGAWPEVAASLGQEHERITVARQGERDLEFVVEHEGNPFSDESFVLGPRRMFRQIEESLGRIELIEGVARSLWAPFRPGFHRLISNPNLDPVREVFEMAIRATLARPGWEHAAIFNTCGEPCRFSEINFAQVSELSLRQETGSDAVSVQWAVLHDSIVLLSDAGVPEVLSIFRQVDIEMNDRWAKGMALAS